LASPSCHFCASPAPDHTDGGKYSAADVVAKAQAVLSEAELLQAMIDVGYFLPHTPPEE
jgi:hypothetical protein